MCRVPLLPLPRSSRVSVPSSPSSLSFVASATSSDESPSAVSPLDWEDEEALLLAGVSEVQPELQNGFTLFNWLPTQTQYDDFLLTTQPSDAHFGDVESSSIDADAVAPHQLQLPQKQRKEGKQPRSAHHAAKSAAHKHPAATAASPGATPAARSTGSRRPKHEPCEAASDESANEDYAPHLIITPDMSSDQIKRIKRERNRLAAEKYRRKGRDLIEQLQARCEQLSKENSGLRASVQQMAQEMAAMREMLHPNTVPALYTPSSLALLSV